MPIDYRDVDRFGNFLRTVVGGRINADMQIHEIGRHKAATEAVSSVIQPYIQAMGPREETVMEAGPPSATGAQNAAPTAGTEATPGETIAQRMNNPLNIKFSDFMAKMGAQPGEAVQGAEAKPGEPKYWSKFPTAEQGVMAAGELLRTGAPYQGKTVDEALRTWSNQGYGADVAKGIEGISPATKVSDLSDQQLDQLVNAMAHRESGYEAGKFTPSGPTPQTTQGAAPTAAPTTRRVMRTPTPAEQQSLTLQAFMQLLSQGTPEARQAAEDLTKFDLMRSNAYGSRAGLQLELVKDDKTGKYVERVFDPVNGTTTYRPTNITFPTSEDENAQKNLEGLRQKAADARATYDSAVQYFGDENAAEKAVADARKAPQGDMLNMSDDEFNSRIQQLFASSLDKNYIEGIRQHYQALRGYLKAKGTLEGANLKLRGLGKMIDEGGALKPYQEPPVKKGEGYSGKAVKKGYAG